MKRVFINKSILSFSTMFIIDDIISWIIGKIMDKFFTNKKENEELIRLRNERIKLYEE